MVGEVLFPQARREKVDLQGGMGIDALEHIDQIDIGIDALEATGGQQTLDDADMARADFRPTEQPVSSAHRNRAESLAPDDWYRSARRDRQETL